MNNTITHSGVIASIEDRHIVVRIVQVSGCASCKVAGHCNAAESKEKLIDIYDVDAARHRVGDAVVVSTSVQTGYRAVAWGFGIPLVIMTGTIFAVRTLTGNEGMAALTGIAALTPYYILLYLLRHKLREKLSFRIE